MTDRELVQVPVYRLKDSVVEQVAADKDDGHSELPGGSVPAEGDRLLAQVPALSLN